MHGWLFSYLAKANFVESQSFQRRNESLSNSDQEHTYQSDDLDNAASNQFSDFHIQIKNIAGAREYKWIVILAVENLF